MTATHSLTPTVKAYLECALWSSIDGDGEPLDADYSLDDFDPSAITSAEEEISAFLSMCSEEGLDLSGISDEQIGHDFWLTRNHHGAGFWDRGLGDLGQKLTDNAHSYGSCDCYVGDNGMVFFM